MRSVEEQIGISENAKKAFREEILIRLLGLSWDEVSDLRARAII